MFTMNLITFFVSLAVVGLILDGMFTYRILQRGGSEVNPLVEWLIKTKKPVPALVVSRLAVMALIVWQPAAAYFLGPIFVGVAYYNFREWKKGANK